ncbi:hypothetical protein AVEN_196652-1 [Araneus ventricosus]|uniref:Tc1-like transposase DDE domain-containing protein n=1 Tax=Araneus ventricosus TaxID=182803 RepID=A0A4Y2E5L4_ARAVE|nr:hypothetical protein AVEN_196652-1 [Araneus ventricosus]
MKTEAVCVQNADCAETAKNDGPQRFKLDVEMLSRIENEHDFLNRVIFSDEATFHVNNKVYNHNCRIWGSEDLHAVQEVERNSPRLNVWCALAHETVIGPFFFAETSVTAHIYLYMLKFAQYPKCSINNPLLSSDNV